MIENKKTGKKSYGLKAKKYRAAKQRITGEGVLQ
jgi:hypothetical protein